MDRNRTGQVSGSAADVYETFFVPALFGEWAPRIADAAGLVPGARVLDVACGTGVLAREAKSRVGDEGRVVGLDRNEGMLAVARRSSQGIEWHAGVAEDLPFQDGAFDAVVSQFGLMFFDDRVAALAEMWRVLAPGGRLVVAVWAGLDHVPGYAAMSRLLAELFGPQVADSLRAPYALGDRGALGALFADAGIRGASVETRDGSARFPSIEAWVHTDVRGWTLAEMIDDAQYARLQEAAGPALREFEMADGSVRFSHPAHVVSAVRI